MNHVLGTEKAKRMELGSMLRYVWSTGGGVWNGKDEEMGEIEAKLEKNDRKSVLDNTNR